MQTPVPLNDLYHEWALAALLAIILIPLVQAAYVVLAKKQRDVIRHYLSIRQSLAGTFRRTLFREVRAVFTEIEDHLPFVLTQPNSSDEARSRFDLLAEGLVQVQADEENGLAMRRTLLRDALAGALVSRVDALLAAEERSTQEQPHEAPPAHFNISFAESTVDDFVYLAQALQLTRQRQRAFTRGRQWTYRLLYGIIPSFVVLVASLLFDTHWAYSLGIGALSTFSVAVICFVVATGVALRARAWLEEKADGPDTNRLIRSEIGS